MSSDSPPGGLRLLAGLIAADLRAGGPALVEPVGEAPLPAPRRGRKALVVVVVAAHRATSRAA